MTEILLSVALLACLKGITEESLRPALWLRLVHAAGAVLFLILLHPLTLQVGRPQVEAFLSLAGRRQDLTLLLVADLSATVALASAPGHETVTRAQLQKEGLIPALVILLRRLLYYLPPLLLLPTLLYLRLELLFALPGFSFWAGTLLLAGVCALLILFAPTVCRALGLGREGMVALSLLMLLCTIVAQAVRDSGAGTTRGADNTPALLLHAGLLLALILLFALAGYLLYRMRSLRARKHPLL